MTDRLPTPNLSNMLTSLRAERSEMLAFTSALTDEEWNAPSAAPSWRIADVVSHIAATARNMYTPGGMVVSFAKSLEDANEGPVEKRRIWSRTKVMAEYERTSRRASTLLAVISRSPMRVVRAPLAELGRFPLGLLIGGALVFDHHTHLRHDIAPALGLPAPATDTVRMHSVLTWMTAVLNNQVAQHPVAGLHSRVSLTLTGPGGGEWWIDESGLRTPTTGTVAARITAPALSFPDWGTQRSSWSDHDVTITGDSELACRFLDSVNVI
ncbi:maleylpyruvate isomerase family mycothiol-dependent enzyme [Rhodococcus opacus]|uniref:Mycothiol-dependent maleylpyruvate isomerase metal-binding domain-containing protein n=1 Tax=Rhodococcus opacus TaxID=37919 RepID=A0A2S8IXI4_RHOOP|nr:maleylpyruvate isomerase family mycothiol-dependent enzyme [Rhodococcus opacus]PQP19514.1 hypothetical protein C5613_30020 [Rhodococcus opacus]